MSASRAAKAFTLDESVTSDAEKFFESDIQQTRAAGLYENAIRPGVVEQFEVDDSQVGTTSKQSFFRFASDALSVKRYQGFFDINVDDISGRIFRSCVPYRGLFEPPPRPSVITAPQSHDLSDSDDSDEVVVASLAATRISGEDASASAVTSMEYAKPFNSNPDLCVLFFNFFWRKIPSTQPCETAKGILFEKQRNGGFGEEDFALTEHNYLMRCAAVFLLSLKCLDMLLFGFPRR